MWNNFLVAFDAVVPIFIIMGVGMIIKKAGLIKPDQVKAFNKIVFLVCFSSLMFVNIYGKELDEALDGKVIGFCVIAVTILYIAATILTITIEKNPKSRGAMIQAIYRSNFVVLGMPIVGNIFGSDKCTLTAGLITVLVPMYNILAVITLEIYRGSKPELKRIVLSVLKNPMIIGAIMGFLVTVLKINIPNILLSPLNSLAASATPMALLILGMSFNRSSIKECRRNVIIVVLARLIIVPGIALFVAASLGFRDVALISMVAIFAAPCAISSFTMAQEMDSDADLAGNCVVFTSLLACFTMFMWIFILKCMGMF